MNLIELYITPHQSIYVEFLHVADCSKEEIKLQKDETIAYKWATREEILNMREEMVSSRTLEMLIEHRF